jgi:RNA polymerase sigma-70 factor, ECF subfamily
LITAVQGLGAWFAQAAALKQLSDSDIVTARRALPMESRILIYLADVKGLAYKEIAEITGVSTEAVAPWLYQARCELLIPARSPWPRRSSAPTG